MRNICIVTGSRAEYGLLRSVMREIQAAETLQLQILASGMHLSPEFGMTIQEIGADGFKPDETVEILLSSDTPTTICKGWVEKYLGNGNNIRDDKWTKGIAVGSKGFVEHVKSALGYKMEV